MRAGFLLLATLLWACGGEKLPRLAVPVSIDPAPVPPRFPLEVHPEAGFPQAQAARLVSAVGQARLGTAKVPCVLALGLRRTRHGALSSVALTLELSCDGLGRTEDEVHASATSTEAAEALAIARLLARLEIELARAEGGTRSAAPPSRVPGVVVLERVAHTRDLLQLRYLEPRSGTVLRDEIVALSDAAHGPPGRWMLSYRTAEGNLLDPLAYRATVTLLRPVLDLREVGDAHAVGYFGLVKLAPETRAPADVTSGDPPSEDTVGSRPSFSETTRPPRR